MFSTQKGTNTYKNSVLAFRMRQKNSKKSTKKSPRSSVKQPLWILPI